MPELPEVEAALEFLRTRARGRTIERVRLLHPSLQRRLTPAQLRGLAGARIDRVERRGKHQLLHLDDGRLLHAHFRMNGDWAITETAAPLPRFARAAIDLDDATSLIFVDSRALGTIDLHPAGVALDLGLGPDAADPEWTAAQLADELARRRGPIKPGRRRGPSGASRPVTDLFTARRGGYAVRSTRTVGEAPSCVRSTPPRRRFRSSTRSSPRRAGMG